MARHVGRTWLGVSLVAFVLAGCVVPDDPDSPDLDDPTADDAKADNPNGTNQPRAVDDAVAGNNPAEVRATILKYGLAVGQHGDWTTMRVPVSRTKAAVREELLRVVADDYARQVNAAITEFNNTTAAQTVGVQFPGVDGQTASDYLHHAINASDQNMVTEFNKEMTSSGIGDESLASTLDPTNYSGVIGYLGFAIEAEAGIGAVASFTVMLIWIPYFEVDVNTVTGEYQREGFTRMEGPFLVYVPNFDAGVGFGFSIGIRAGGGLIYGDIKSASDLMGAGVGISCSVAIPVVHAGLGGKLIWVPLSNRGNLYYFTVGMTWGIGTGGGGCHANAQVLMSWDGMAKLLTQGLNGLNH